MLMEQAGCADSRENSSVSPPHGTEKFSSEEEWTCVDDPPQHEE